MFRHLQKRQKLSKAHPEDLPTGGSDSDSDSDSDSGSGSGSQTDDEEQSSEGSGEESQEDGDSDESEGDEQRIKRAAKIPASLLKVMENPIVYPGDGDDTDQESASSDSEGSTSEKSSNQNIRSQNKAFPICLVCPGKLLKTDTLLEEHTRGQTHKRRLARYKDFIHNPPPHTSLSPDASEVIELIDALIGPPPVVQAGSVLPKKKQKRKKRKQVKQTKSEDKPPSQPLKTTSEKNTNSKSAKSDQKKTTPKKRERVRKGKRERQESLAKIAQVATS
ncbi:hypothetical protein MJO28_002412 [Puccinia striiformis f. sp. tritici]|uniref:Uncharacterized protein n=2 Tax=Puccinia striiformis TaxID=27350 RepID=A0A2S4UWE5_9BASI|nr:hypothetical protein MJO28_002412 [Puccinia striiformis f. sp. tritici]POW01607.1 hypothetical protein PSTT_12383 [Puccinia striiformis]